MKQLMRKPIVFTLLFAVQPIVVGASQKLECGLAFVSSPQSIAATPEGRVQSVYTLSYDSETPLTLSQALDKLAGLQKKANTLTWEENVKFQRLAGQYLRALVDTREIELFKSYLKSGLPVWLAHDFLDDSDGGIYGAGEYAFETAVQLGLLDFVEATLDFLKGKGMHLKAALSRVTPLTAQALDQNSTISELLKSNGLTFDPLLVEHYRLTPSLIQKLKGLASSKSVADLEELLKVLFPYGEFLDVRINRYPTKSNETGDNFYNAKFRLTPGDTRFKTNLTVIAFTKPVSFLQTMTGAGDRTMISTLDAGQQKIVSVKFDSERKQFSVLLQSNKSGNVLKNQEMEITVSFGADELVSSVTLSSKSGLGFSSSIETLRFRDLWSTSRDFDMFNEVNSSKFNYKHFPSRNGVIAPLYK